MKNKVLASTGVVYRKRISDMKVGENGYTVPWAYDPGTKELNDVFSIHKYKGGTVEMKVEKTKSGFIVDVQGDYEY